MDVLKLPLLLVAQRNFLESLQNGNLYMKNCLYYQQIEQEDEQRGDKYDSAIPSKLFKIPNVSNGRITFLNTYIKCFFQYRPENIEHISNKQFALHMPQKSAEALLDISKETDGFALLIYDTETFMRRFIKKCDELHCKYWLSDVEYIDDSAYTEYEYQLQQAVTAMNQSVKNPTFIKRKKYEAQQEFRIAVSCHKNNIPDKTMIFFPLDEFNKIRNSFVKMNIEPISDISTIVNLKEIIDEPFMLICN